MYWKAVKNQFNDNKTTVDFCSLQALHCAAAVSGEKWGESGDMVFHSFRT